MLLLLFCFCFCCLAGSATTPSLSTSGGGSGGAKPRLRSRSRLPNFRRSRKPDDSQRESSFASFRLTLPPPLSALLSGGDITANVTENTTFTYSRTPLHSLLHSLTHSLLHSLLHSLGPGAGSCSSLSAIGGTSGSALLRDLQSQGVANVHAAIAAAVR